MSVKTLDKDVVDGQNQSMEVLAKRSETTYLCGFRGHRWVEEGETTKLVGRN